MKSVGVLLAPFAYAFGRLLRRPQISSRAIDLDPQYLRGYEQKLLADGCSPEMFRIFSIATRLCALTRNGSDQIIKNLISESYSQLLQDIVCVLGHSRKTNGYFVEIGVGDGTRYSNTRLLEDKFGWNGILAEPAKGFHERIRSTRAAILDDRAVYNVSGEQLTFDEDDEAGEYSGIVDHSTQLDAQKYSRYQVETITLDDLLADHGAPSAIDYISIDTEGSELEVLQGFSLNKYKVGLFTIEHNFDQAKLDALRAKLIPAGYRQIFCGVSLFDAWFVHSELQSPYLPE